METQTKTAKLPLPPEAEGGWPIGSATIFIKNPLKFFEANVPKYGPIFQVTSLFFKVSPNLDRMVVISDPDMVKHIMQDNNKNYRKSYGYSVLELLIGKGLLTSEGDFWRKQRRLMQPGFHRDRLASFVSIMTEEADALVDKWKKLPDGTEVDVSVAMMGVTLKIVSRAMFSTDVGDAVDVVHREFDRANELLTKRIMTAFKIPIDVPTPYNKREKKTYSDIKQVVVDVIAKRRKSTEKYDDLLSMLMEVQDADTGEKMSDKQVLDEVITIFLAGYETTAVALGWLMHAMDENPHIEQEILNEEKEVLNGRTPVLEDVRTLKYSRMVVDETLRLYPPAWVIGRQTLSEDEIGGYRIPKNTVCLMPTSYIHRDEKYWKDPLKFDPTRFNEENSKGRHKFEYFPFGGGPRLCIGNNFALMEMQLVVPMILRHFKLRKPKGFTFEKDPLITLRPKPHLRMVVSKR